VTHQQQAATTSNSFISNKLKYIRNKINPKSYILEISNIKKIMNNGDNDNDSNDDDDNTTTIHIIF
jgi:hypothetical protein